MGEGVTRRGLLGAAGGGALGLALGGGAGVAIGRHREAGSGGGAVPFHGAHQAGIATPAQDRLVFAALDVTLDAAAGLRDLLRAWTASCERMTAGRPVGAAAGDPAAPPQDTGEALDLPAAALTVTIGFGPSVF